MRSDETVTVTELSSSSSSSSGLLSVRVWYTQTQSKVPSTQVLLLTCPHLLVVVVVAVTVVSDVRCNVHVIVKIPSLGHMP
jgi:hypothetical protein